MVINALNVTTQLVFWVLSINKSAICGIDTFISDVHCNRSNYKYKIYLL